MPAIDGWFEQVLERGASDLHLAVNHPPMARVNGEIVSLRDAALSAQELEEMLFELVSPLQRTRLVTDLDLELVQPYKDVARFRASYAVKHSGLAASFRLVPARVPSIAELGCPDILRDLADRRSGLVLVSGPSSSGRTTTAAAMLDHINRIRPCHVLTIESTIEFVHTPVRAQLTQREVGAHVPTFAAALETAAHEDADVVFVSELESTEVIERALHLATNGTLVLATVLGSDVAGTIDRLMSLFDPKDLPRIRNLFVDALPAIIVQHLVRAADTKGRVAAHEIFVASAGMGSLLRDAKSDLIGDAMKGDGAHGVQTLDASLQRLLEAGQITVETALERAHDKDAFGRKPPSVSEPKV